MLKEIAIKNFAIIDELELSFTEGFNVFTGETGAGKSIILDAVSIVLGEKADTSFVREGSARASIEAIFDYGGHREEILAVLEREDLMPDDDIEEVTLLREIRLEGRSIARVNGHSVSISLLQEIGGLLVDIHGQSEHLSLLKPSSHIGLVDQFAGNAELLKKYRGLYKKLTSARKQLRDLQTDEEESLRQQDLLNYQINEITAAELSEDEEETLLQERTRLANGEKIIKLVRQSLQTLEGRSDQDSGILDRLDILNKAVEGLAGYDASLSSLSETVITLYDQMNDVLDIIQRYRRGLDFDSRKQEEIEERLMTINTLKRKYGGSIPAVLAFCEKAQEKLSRLTNADAEMAALSEAITGIEAELSKLAIRLNTRRVKASQMISEGVVRELKDLRMPSAEFSVRIAHEESENGIPDADGKKLAFTDTGFDKIEFLIAPNPGEGLKPLAKVASGGETSRLMLAMKNTLAQADRMPTMVFDEIDQGIGGRVGAVVGEKLWELSRYHQVICITHLPQLAALYDSHYHVRKRVTENRTSTVVTRLSQEESFHEMASLLGADNEENIRAVRVMLADALTYKKTLNDRQPVK